MVMGSSAATSGSCSGSGGAEEGREGGEGDREVMVPFFFLFGDGGLLFALGLVWFAVLRGFRVVGCVGLICVSCELV
jgi:hypothetical protein